MAVTTAEMAFPVASRNGENIMPILSLHTPFLYTATALGLFYIPTLHYRPSSRNWSEWSVLHYPMTCMNLEKPCSTDEFRQSLIVQRCIAHEEMFAGLTYGSRSHAVSLFLGPPRSSVVTLPQYSRLPLPLPAPAMEPVGITTREELRESFLPTLFRLVLRTCRKGIPTYQD